MSMLYGTVVGGFLGLVVGLLISLLLAQGHPAGMVAVCVLGIVCGGVIGSRLQPIVTSGALLGFISVFVLCTIPGVFLLQDTLDKRSPELGDVMVWLLGFGVIIIIAPAAGVLGALFCGRLTQELGARVPAFLGRMVLVELVLLLVWGIASWGRVSYRASQQRAKTERREAKRRESELQHVAAQPGSQGDPTPDGKSQGAATQPLPPPRPVVPSIPPPESRDQPTTLGTTQPVLAQPFASARTMVPATSSPEPGAQHSVTPGPPLPSDPSLLDLAARTRQAEDKLPALLGPLLYPNARLLSPPGDSYGVSMMLMDTRDDIQTVIAYYAQVIPDGKRTPTDFLGYAKRPGDGRQTSIYVKLNQGHPLIAFESR